MLCDEWTPTQVKAFRLLVNRSATWANWDEELLALTRDLQDLEGELSRQGETLAALKASLSENRRAIKEQSKHLEDLKKQKKKMGRTR